MPRIPEALVRQIKEANDIVSVVEQYLPLQKKSRSNYFGLCPFHNEDTPSFSVSPGQQFFYCFGCHKGGDVVNFVKEIEHVDYPEALRILAERAQIPLPEFSSAEYRAEKARGEALNEIMLEAARFYYRQLQAESAAHVRAYLKRRKISEENAKRFGLGFAPGRGDGLYAHLHKKGFADALLLESGLFKRGDSGRVYSLFRNRLMFPILSATGKGRVIAFGGRVLDDAKPKYINSPETSFFVKGRHLYGLNLAKKSAADFFLLVEGYLDVMAAFEAGVDCALAPLGTALSQAQAKLLAQYKSRVVLCFDADRAGRSAALRSLALLEEAGLDLEVLEIPEGKDPDDYVRTQGGEAFRALLAKTVPALDFRLKLAEQAALEKGKFNPQAYLKGILQILPDIRYDSIREQYLIRAAQRMGVSLDSVKADLAAALKAREQSAPPGSAPGARSEARATGGPGARAADPAAAGGEAAPDARAAEAGGARPEALSPALRAHYRAAAALTFMLSRRPALAPALPKPVSGAMLEPLGPQAFTRSLAETLNAQRLGADNLYDFVSREHPQPEALLSELARLNAEALRYRRDGSDPKREEQAIREDALRNYAFCLSSALQKQRDLLLQALAEEGQSAEERAARLAYLELVEKELSRVKELQN